MPLDIAKFNSAYTDARDRVEREQADVATQQTHLRTLVPEDATQEHRDWAEYLIASLARPPAPPRQWSELYHEAGRIQVAAYQAEGTVEEQIAALREARRRIWEIADRAAEDEAPHIRAMTRSMEHIEDGLRNPLWPQDD
ncbi:hypothetical protein BWI15_03055 [Kribbella sp. ALI-6-A]|uniref:hypothetical protein n=1 Tax=Kribbella sp. ALI-6-A TaxID=1933817 RepID=UPI00097C08F0|nr:hypothetical protein [Kribbella sp. ALI-6-A]ONI77505.1 hypothetical protein BWI15_03055 [Kribbella sp. ALI-6-A]